VTGITISYWEDQASIKSWKANLEHLLAQKKGKKEWYLHYDIKIAKVEREYSGGIEFEGEQKVAHET
jgi:heme-degrading monooxygenase HmoA